MQWNGQRPALEHLIALRQADTKEKIDALQRDFNGKRLARIHAALSTRPVYIPVKFSMTAAAQTAPYSATTPSLGYDVIITGVKSDIQTRDIFVRRTESEKPLVYVGEQSTLRLRADDLAGITSTTGGGQQGVFYLPSPMELSAGQRITIEMYKQDVTALPEVANIVLVGIRVFPKSYIEQVLDSDEMAKVERLMQYRRTPSTVFLKSQINFDNGGVGGQVVNLWSPTNEEPLLLRGLRTTLRQSTISLRLENEPVWTLGQTPIWGIAGEDEAIDNYQWFSKPVYLHSNNQISIDRIVNGDIDGVHVDTQTGNTLTWICETV